MRIYLIGYMGCGKSTIGRRLAAELGLHFIDLDKYIEERCFKTIPVLFAEEGESGFRERERNALNEVTQFENVVVGTGGGAPCFFDNMELMNQNGITIYLSPDIETLANRLMKSKTERPLIAGKSREELMAFIANALKIRGPFYEKAQHTVRVESELDPTEVVTEILKFI